MSGEEGLETGVHVDRARGIPLAVSLGVRHRLELHAERLEPRDREFEVLEGGPFIVFAVCSPCMIVASTVATDGSRLVHVTDPGDDSRALVEDAHPQADGIVGDHHGRIGLQRDRRRLRRGRGGGGGAGVTPSPQERSARQAPRVFARGATPPRVGWGLRPEVVPARPGRGPHPEELSAGHHQQAISGKIVGEPDRALRPAGRGARPAPEVGRRRPFGGAWAGLSASRPLSRAARR